MQRPLPPRIISHIKTHRAAAKLTQKQVAESLGVQPHLITYYERGQVWPGPENMIALCDLLQCTLGDLYEVVPEK